MIPYKDINRDSNVYAYEIGPDYVRIEFKTGGLSLHIRKRRYSKH